ncbi:MAG: PHP domain-containing protein [Candidatus Pacebacteria bacterium]|nr:PHP domain-containing protein [Candidatus Paceibacterota bacterium]MCF7856931.1 PHP domain-containing protein [Candidatus Paceibacterota bacterium]
MEMKEYKGILHCHSTYSYDAKLSLLELKKLFQEKGLSFVCMTEHVDELTPERSEEFVRECEVLSDDSFRFIPGFEVPYKHAHILMIGMREFLGKYASTLEVLKTWTSKAEFVVLAHPVRNHFEVEDGLLEQIDALEVWNQQYEGKRVPRTRSVTLLDGLRKQKPLLLAVGGVDFHRTEHFGSPVTTLSVEKLTEATILEKLQTGAYSVSSDKAFFYGTLPNSVGLLRAHRLESLVSVTVIVMGKFVNKILASLGLSLPKSFRNIIRKRL